MASWAEFERSAPNMAAVAERLWPGITRLGRLVAQAGTGGTVFAIAYLATTRPDASPRLHPFCPIIAGGRLFAAIPARSPKGDDLRRGGRCVIPALPCPDGGELCAETPARSPKGDDVRRDGRCVIHALPGPDDDELCIRARAREVTDGGATRTIVVDVVSRSGGGGMSERTG